jgi:uncharacterized delta-60 repeat protein
MFRLHFLPIAAFGLLLFGSPVLRAADPVSPRNANGSISKAVPQPDGKVIVVGSFSYIGKVERAGIARLNGDGTLDSTFDPGGGANGAINLVALQSDGKILIVGPFTSVDGTTRHAVARLNSDGTLDSSFDAGTGLESNGLIYDLQIDSSGKAVLAGAFDVFNNVTRHQLVRLNLDGTVDLTFDAGKNFGNLDGGFGGWVKRFAFYPDGQLIAIGIFKAANKYDLVRVAVDGTVDQNFMATGVSNAAVVAQPDGRVLIGDGAVNENTHGGLNRLNANGQTDITFHATADAPTFLRLQPDGDILLLDYDYSLRRLLYSGTDDPTFQAPQIASGSSAFSALKGMELQADGRIIIYGSFHSVNGLVRFGVARLLSDGSVDPTFVPDQSIIATGFALNLSTRLLVGTGENVVLSSMEMHRRS